LPDSEDAAVPDGAVAPESEENGAPRPIDSALVIQMPVDVRHVTFTLGAIVAAIWLLRNTQEVLIPFVVSGLLFYALDPLVDRLQRWRVPRSIGATVVLVSVIGASGAVVYALSDQMIEVVEQVPQSARLLRDQLRKPAAAGEQGAIEKVQQAADAIDRTAAESAAPSPAPRGVQRVQIEQPPFRASD
jgi:predicted PurR-regulated permease PerM